MDLLPLIPTGASRVPGISGPNQGLIWTLRLWSPPGLHLILVTQVPTWTSPGSGDSGPNWTSPGPGDSLSNMDLTWIWCLWSSFSPLLDLVSLIPTFT